MLGSEKFYGVQLGPSSPGLSWMLSVTNVSITPYTFTEQFSGDFAVLAKDNVKLEFQAHTVFKLKPDPKSVRDFFEHYSFIGHTEAEKAADPIENAYANFLKEPFRTFLREQVQQRNGLDVKDQSTAIGTTTQTAIKKYAEGSPFEIDNVVIGNIQYPKVIADAVAWKLSATQDLLRQETEIEIERKLAEKRKVEAAGIATAMDLIQAKLTNQYLQHEAIEAQKLQITSPNHTVIYIPVGANGVPVTEAGRATNLNK